MNGREGQRQERGEGWSEKKHTAANAFVILLLQLFFFFSGGLDWRGGGGIRDHPSIQAWDCGSRGGHFMEESAHTHTHTDCMHHLPWPFSVSKYAWVGRNGGWVEIMQHCPSIQSPLHAALTAVPSWSSICLVVMALLARAASLEEP